MRKNNDGYVIIYVVFVLVFLCIVAVSVCSVSLSNLQTQTAQTQQLQSKYAAMGEIEKFMAEVCTSAKDLKGQEYSSEAEAEATGKSAVEQCISAALGLGTTLNASWSEQENLFVVTVDIATDTKINTDISFYVALNTSEYTVTTKEPVKDNNGEVTEPGEYEVNYKYEITDVTAQYTSFEIGGAA